MARVGNTREEDVVVRVVCNGTKVTPFDKRFVGVVEMRLLDEKEVWVEVMDDIFKVCRAREE